MDINDNFLDLKKYIDKGNYLYKNSQYINFDIDTTPNSETQGQLLLYSTNTGDNILNFSIDGLGYLKVAILESEE